MESREKGKKLDKFATQLFTQWNSLKCYKYFDQVKAQLSSFRK